MNDNKKTCYTCGTPITKAYCEDFPEVCEHWTPKKTQTCNVGDKVYQVADGVIYESTINKIVYDAGHIAFDKRAIGKSIFLTKEEAEQALKGGADNG